MKQKFQYEVLFTPKRDIFREIGLSVSGFATGVVASTAFWIYLHLKEAKDQREAIKKAAEEIDEAMNEEKES